MKTYSLRSGKQKCGGVALIVVLAVLALMLVLAVAFLGRSSTEKISAKSYQAGASARTLANDAVNLVQAQIDLATQVGTDQTWTSQPGLVRVFDDAGDSVAAYKLYSAATLGVHTANLISDLTGDIPDAGWSNKPAVWVDINQRVRTGGEDYFPILDPRAMVEDTSDSSDPGAVEGLSITELPGAGGNLGAMPVRWLYALRDGRLVTPLSDSGTRVEFDSSVVTKANPVVGRVAFWTDDESCKVNVNTAGEGTYWDVPRARSEQERDLGDKQPAQREYSRYPGHPATTSLSAVFPKLSAQRILESGITPRYQWGGSEAGTQVATNPVPLRTDRLYATAAETIFDSARNDSILNNRHVQRRSFFLTAHSRAPETNLFNLPRIAIWPLHTSDTSNYRTTFDQLIARCSTINDHRYYFQREQAYSPTHDFTISRNLDIYNYLLRLSGTDIPAFGGHFAGTTGKYPDEMPQVLTEIFDYIRSTNLVDPELEQSTNGVVFSAKADLGSASPHNMTPGYGVAAPIRHPSNDTMGLGRFYTLAEFALHFICTADAGDGTNPEGIAQSNIPPTSSTDPINRNRTLELHTPLAPNERRIQAMVHLRFFSPAQGWVTMHPRMTIEVDGLDAFNLSGQQLFPASANGSIEIGRWAPDQGNNSTAYGGNAGIFYPLFSKRAPSRGNMPADPDGAGAEDIYPFISNFVTVNAANGSMPFTGGTVTVKISSGNTLNGPSPELVQTITLNVPNGTFPIPQLPVGAGAGANSTDQYLWAFAQSGAQPDKETRGRLYGIARRQGEIGYGLGVGFQISQDVIRSMVLRHGDLRLTASQEQVPATEFVKHPEWDDPSVHFAHHLYQGRPDIKWPLWSSSAKRGSHVDPVGLVDGKYLTEIPFEAPRTANTQPVVTNRDWDTGTAYAMDGPYINKPDEGNTYRVGVVPYMYGGNLVGAQGFTFFSPNRQMPSSGMFGSLPVGVKTGSPWRTLLFRPQENHPAWAVSPKDHLLMDLFWMPVVEPYAISEPFSTAGKINMNYQIFPFTNIERSTGMHAVLKGEKLAAIPVTSADTYKNTTSLPSDIFRKSIDVEQTLKQCKARFANGDVFRSASEICDIYIIPSGETVANNGVWGNRNAFWDAHRLTGDNLRERIYTTLYPRLTVRSNVFKVHVWAQTLQSPTMADAHVWDESKGAIVGSYRGSTTIERFIDPNNPNIPDYTGNTANVPTLDAFYRWRTVGNVQFAP